MKRKYESNDYYLPLKKRKVDITILFEKIKEHEYKLEKIIEKINNIDKRLKNVENFIEENKQPIKFNNPPSYFY